MPLKDVLTKEYGVSDIVALLRTDKLLKKDKLRFAPSGRSVKLLHGERSVMVVPLRTLAVFPFSFPFGKKVSVRDALELRFRPLLGSYGSKLNLVTQITKQKSNETVGVAWFVSKEEAEQFEHEFRDAVLWPAPYAFASRVKGNGIVVCCYDEGCCGMVFVAGEPKLYRWMSAEKGDAKQLWEKLVLYGKRTFEADLEVCIVYPMKDTALQKAGDETLELYPSAYNLNLSSVNLSAKAETDRFVNKLSRFGYVMAMFGIVFLVSSLLLLGVNIAFRSSFAEAPSLIYETVLGEKSANPLSCVMQKLRLLNAEGSGQESFRAHIKRISSVWSELPNPPVFDEMRYSTDKIQLSGTAAGAAEVDALRNALADNGYDAVTDSAQQIPKTGMRFTISLSLTGGKKR